MLSDFILVDIALPFGGIIFTAYVLNSGLLDHIDLIRKDKNIKLTIDELPESIEDVNRCKSQIDFGGISDESKRCVLKFVSTIEENANFDTTNFYRNFKPDSIIEYRCSPKRSKLGGTYQLGETKRIFKFRRKKTGTIDIYTPKVQESLFHELFHEASSCSYEDVDCVGFSRIKWTNKKRKQYIYRIGIGLNEGYTQLLTERNFYNEGVGISYITLVDIARMIEYIVGRDLMERLYSKGDLASLLKELSIYSSYEEALTLIRKLDHLYSVLYEIEEKLPKRLAKRTFRDIILSVSKMYLAKLKIAPTTDINTAIRESLAFSGLLSLPYCFSKDGSYKIPKEVSQELLEEKEKIMNLKRNQP